MRSNKPQHHIARVSRSSSRLAAGVAIAGALSFASTLACEEKAPFDVAVPKPAAEASPGVQPARVEVGSDGFRPARIALGTNRTLVFRRTTDATCATEVVFPTLEIEKPLPLNTDVTIELPAALDREVTFQCGMGMLRGKVVAQ